MKDINENNENENKKVEGDNEKFSDKEEIKKHLQNLKDDNNLSEDEIIEINNLLKKIDINNKNKSLNRDDIDKKTVFRVIRKVFLSFAVYYIMCFAMFGLFSKWFNFTPNYYIWLVTLGYAVYMVLFRYICRLISEKTHHYLSIYNIFSLITILLIYELGQIISVFHIEGFMVIISFYYISEILNTTGRHYLFKYLPSKFKWRNKQ